MSEPLECTSSVCNAPATKIMGWRMVGPAMFVAPYCDEHADDVERAQGGLCACGPALSTKARKIEGRR